MIHNIMLETALGRLEATTQELPQGWTVTNLERETTEELIPPTNNTASSPIKLVVWNARGTGNTLFYRNFMELIRTNDPSIVILMETRVSGSRPESICNSLGFSGSHRVDADGRAGGIWLLWKAEFITVETSGSSFQELHVVVKGRGKKCEN